MTDYKESLLLAMKNAGLPPEEQVVILADKYNEAMNLVHQLLSEQTGLVFTDAPQMVEVNERMVGAYNLKQVMPDILLKAPHQYITNGPSFYIKPTDHE